MYIFNCPKVKSTEGLPKAKYLKLMDMKGLTDLKGVDVEVELELLNCPNLESFKGIESKKLQELAVIYCPKMEDETGLPKNKITRVRVSVDTVQGKFKDRLKNIVKKGCQWFEQ